MYIRRSYSQPFYRKRRQSNIPLILALLALIGAVPVVVLNHFETIQAAALQTVGVQAPATPIPGVMANNAAVKFTQGDLQGAKADYEAALRAEPNNVAYLYEYGRVLLELNLSGEAVPIADRAIEIAPNDVRGYALKANALAWSDPGNAVPIAKQGRELNPNFSPIYSAMAIAYNNLSFYNLAIEYGQQAIALDPNNPDTYRAYAWPLIYTAQYDLAIENLTKAVELNPNLTGPYFQLAFEYKAETRANNPEMAVAIYEHIISMTPSAEDAAKANLRICETYAGVAEADFSTAEPFCREAIRIKPDYGSAYRELGRMRYNRRNYEGSIEAFETCVALGASDIECWYLRGLAHFWMGECDEAWTVLNEAAVRAAAQGEGEGTINQINIGLSNVRVKCPAYNNMPEPTAVQSTPIPPTPIGGL
jgi:tetratricopeptide (TPR) repeat protein